MESKLALADSTAQATHTALYVAGKRGGGRLNRRGVHRGGGKRWQHSLDHNSSSGRSRPDQDNKRGVDRMAESKTAPTPMVARPPSTLDNIQYAVNRVSQSIHAPTEQKFQALKQILRYLKGSSRRGLLFQKRNLELSVYSDSDWVNDKDDRCFATGYLLFLGPNLIYWCTKKQTRVSRSSTKADYRAMAARVAEAMWLHHITDALGLPPF
uniref:Reverse transcriptase Ty1/copia-type domain-containing protein n=1 Tax=Solanum lycopersicum TaxID=4081 RepID=A0A3Q7HLY9_SOLLC